jgi:hypothetical protein
MAAIKASLTTWVLAAFPPSVTIARGLFVLVPFSSYSKRPEPIKAPRADTHSFLLMEGLFAATASDYAPRYPHSKQC